MVAHWLLQLFTSRTVSLKKTMLLLPKCSSRDSMMTCQAYSATKTCILWKMALENPKDPSNTNISLAF